MGVNLINDHGWGQVFGKTSNKPTLPDQLTPKWWSKQKQLIAAGKETGIGKALEEVQKLYKALAFPSIMGRQDMRERDTTTCQAFMNSTPLKSFVKQLGVVQKLAKEHAKDFNTTLLKKTGTALAAIGDAAEEVAEVCEEKHLESCLKTALNEAVDKKYQVLVKNAEEVFHARDQVLVKLTGELQKIIKLVGQYALDRRPATGQLVGGALSHLCRDMTQVLFNLLKLDEGGFELEGFNSVKASTLNEKLQKWGDTKTAISYDQPTEATADVKAVGELIKEYIPLVKAVKTPKAS